VYTGAIGYVAPGGDLQFSVAIRTAVVDPVARRLSFGVGSGIVWDSDADAEYRECLLKGVVLERRDDPFDLLETLAWSPLRGYAYREEHVRRLQHTAAYFGVPSRPSAVAAALDAAGAGCRPLRDATITAAPATTAATNRALFARVMGTLRRPAYRMTTIGRQPARRAPACRGATARRAACPPAGGLRGARGHRRRANVPTALKKDPCAPISAPAARDVADTRPVEGTEADEELAALAKAIGHPARVQIMRLLVRREACICGDIVDELPLAQSTVSQHLKVLKDAGLIRGEIDGPRVCYCVEPRVLRRLKALVGSL
jgi:ArsR family transcriptional regulator